VNKNKTIGYVDIRVPVLKPTILIFRKIAHVQSGDRRWFNLPTFSREKQDNAQDYLRFCQFETEVFNGQLLDCLGERVKEFCEKNHIEDVPVMGFDEFPTTQDGCPF